jgi:hypothetical protein
MMLRNDTELKTTKRKLADIEKLIAQTRIDNVAATTVEIRSLMRLANQLREEIARYQATPTSAQN